MNPDLSESDIFDIPDPDPKGETNPKSIFFVKKISIRIKNNFYYVIFTFVCTLTKR